ncbi:Protein of unknown function [Salegentibacter holothuriorum]|uniref:DUF3347 domain-containing protein n=1 Tax=Salegentibacter holothuriorum TaxID=241145 RepID=A0A1T5BC95_9FLAO|nr:DUF3347 domain-containing protein [Salegentibacter holothuriorum]SKB44848.1 Protein of unknown function [Salegentibacter holothuriorum]
MKRNLRSLTMLSIIAGSLVIFSCKNEEKENDAPEPMQHEMHQPDEQAKTETYKGEQLQAQFKDEKTAKTYNLYVEIKDAFVNTDAKMASEKASELAKTTENDEIAAIANSIAESSDVNKQREAFSKLTEAMEPILMNALESGAIFKQYCPMAFEGKGDYWYSNSKDIFNPYYGDKMLKCGRVEATIQ